MTRSERAGLGKVLEPIQSYCILKGLPPLSSLVVGKTTGLPGPGFIAAEDVPRAQAKTYRFNWLSRRRRRPTPTELEAAVVKLPSNGRSLDELVKKARNLP